MFFRQLFMSYALVCTINILGTGDNEQKTELDHKQTISEKVLTQADQGLQTFMKYCASFSLKHAASGTLLGAGSGLLIGAGCNSAQHALKGGALGIAFLGLSFGVQYALQNSKNGVMPKKVPSKEEAAHHVWNTVQNNASFFISGAFVGASWLTFKNLPDAALSGSKAIPAGAIFGFIAGSILGIRESSAARKPSQVQ